MSSISYIQTNLMGEAQQDSSSEQYFHTRYWLQLLLLLYRGPRRKTPRLDTGPLPTWRPRDELSCQGLEQISLFLLVRGSLLFGTTK